jgi:hypothetical protein
MKTIKELFESRQNREISCETITNIDWTNNMSDIFDLGYERMKELVDFVRNPLIEMCEDFYEKNPTKRAITYTRDISIGLDFNDIDKSPEVKKLYNVLRDIGGAHWWYCCSTIDQDMRRHESIATMKVSIKLNSKKALNDRDSIKLDVKEYKESKRDTREYGNGYNGLPGEAIQTLREEVLKCATGATLVLTETKFGTLTLTIYPVFNISKVKKLTNAILNDDKAQEYADRYRSVSAGIERYYAEKRASGDNYTGD